MDVSGISSAAAAGAIARGVFWLALRGANGLSNYPELLPIGAGSCQAHRGELGAVLRKRFSQIRICPSFKIQIDRDFMIFPPKATIGRKFR